MLHLAGPSVTFFRQSTINGVKGDFITIITIYMN